jgi:crotonobetainyl-CoA:carnitine CoA-transferase CaiB-like acyl-CoA transferase
VPELGALIGLAQLEEYVDPDTWWTEQTTITRLLADHLATRSTGEWLEILDPADVWCAPVLTLPELVGNDGFRALDMTQQTERPGADGGGPVAIQTIRTPVRFDGRVLKNNRGAPRLGEHTEAIRAEFAHKEAAL